MKDMIESLMSGDDRYARALVAAKDFWGEFYTTTYASNAALQTAIEAAQGPFQRRLEREAGLLAPFSQSIMALTAVGALYADGFDDEPFARQVLQAFLTSKRLSIGVINFAEDAQSIYF